MVKTPDGLLDVRPGDFLFFPADESGTHKITNTSETELLVYLDFDTSNRVDAAIYPDSGKIGIGSGNAFRVFRLADKVDYYEGE